MKCEYPNITEQTLNLNDFFHAHKEVVLSMSKTELAHAWCINFLESATWSCTLHWPKGKMHWIFLHETDALAFTWRFCDDSD